MTPWRLLPRSRQRRKSLIAQQRSIRIGVLVGRQKSTFLPPIIKRLGELGYVEGKNLVVDYRSADGVLERFPLLARELIEAQCDVIFAIGAEQTARAGRRQITYPGGHHRQ